MVVFFDTEFTTLSEKGYLALISIGFVSVDGREFYAELIDTWQKGMCSTFVIDTVLPLLDGGECRMTEAQLAIRLKEWIENLGYRAEDTGPHRRIIAAAENRPGTWATAVGGCNGSGAGGQ